MLKILIAVFLTIFVASNAINTIPTYIKYANKKLLKEITITTFIIGITFIIIGDYIFMLFGVNIGQFEIAGGIILFMISVKNITSNDNQIKNNKNQETIGVIPIAIPYIMGPGALTALITLKNIYPLYVIIIAFILNIIINHIMLKYSEKIYKIFKTKGISIAEKIMSIMFASYGIMLIEKGLIYIKLIK
jgi:multiple antibiotic resistance protein